MLTTAKQRSTEKCIFTQVCWVPAAMGLWNAMKNISRAIASINPVSPSEFIWRHQGRKERSKQKQAVYNMTFWKVLALKQHTGKIETIQGAGLGAGTCSEENLKSKYLSTEVHNLHTEKNMEWFGLGGIFKGWNRIKQTLYWSILPRNPFSLLFFLGLVWFLIHFYFYPRARSADKTEFAHNKRFSLWNCKQK